MCNKIVRIGSESRFGDKIKNDNDLHNCYMEWVKSDVPMRFGQWLCDNYIVDNKPWLELFYEKGHIIAYDIALKEINKIKQE